MNYRMIKNVLGWILLFESMFMALPLITAAIYGESEFFTFIMAMVICAAVGGLMLLGKPKSKRR